MPIMVAMVPCPWCLPGLHASQWLLGCHAHDGCQGAMPMMASKVPCPAWLPGSVSVEIVGNISEDMYAMYSMDVMPKMVARVPCPVWLPRCHAPWLGSASHAGNKTDTSLSPYWCMGLIKPASYRLLHSPSLVALGLSVGYETWPPTGWHHALVIGWSKYRLELPQPKWILGSHNWWEFPPFLQRPLTVPLHSLNGRQMPAVRAVQGDCERVYGGWGPQNPVNVYGREGERIAFPWLIIGLLPRPMRDNVTL